MAQIYPSPSIYTYRVHAFGKLQIPPGPPPNGPVFYVIEYSSNSGSTWNPASNQLFNSLQDAYQQIAQLVSQEATFASQQTSVNPLVGPYVVYSYPV
jgi:hypothetical protein